MSNNAPRCIDRAAALRTYNTLGKSSAAGELKGAEFLELVAENVRLGHHSATLDEAKEVYAAYRKGKVAGLGTLTVDVFSEANFKQRTSDVMNVMVCAADSEINFCTVLAEARPIIVRGKNDKTHKLNTWDAFVAIARAQRAKPGDQLDEAGIEQALLPKTATPKDRNEIISLEDLIKRLEKHIQGTAKDGEVIKEGYPSERAEGALQLLRDQITLIQYNTAQAKAAHLLPKT